MPSGWPSSCLKVKNSYESLQLHLSAWPKKLCLKRKVSKSFSLKRPSLNVIKASNMSFQKMLLLTFPHGSLGTMQSSSSQRLDSPEVECFPYLQLSNENSMNSYVRIFSMAEFTLLNLQQERQSSS